MSEHGTSSAPDASGVSASHVLRRLITRLGILAGSAATCWLLGLLAGQAAHAAPADLVAHATSRVGGVVPKVDAPPVRQVVDRSVDDVVRPVTHAVYPVAHAVQHVEPVVHRVLRPVVAVVRQIVHHAAPVVRVAQPAEHLIHRAARLTTVSSHPVAAHRRIARAAAVKHARPASHARQHLDLGTARSAAPTDRPEPSRTVTPALSVTARRAATQTASRAPTTAPAGRRRTPTAPPSVPPTAGSSGGVPRGGTELVGVAADRAVIRTPRASERITGCASVLLSGPAARPGFAPD